MKNKMKKLLSYILLTLTLGLVSCSEDEPNNPVRDYIQYNCIDVTFNDNVLTEHPNIISWNNRYQLEDDFIKSWYTDYFIGSTLTFRNSGISTDSSNRLMMNKEIVRSCTENGRGKGKADSIGKKYYSNWIVKL